MVPICLQGTEASLHTCPLSTPRNHNTTYKMASAQTSFPLQDLCARALSSPSSITPSERALILGSPDPATENDLYIAATSLPLPALVAKALATPPTLSPQEAHVLVHGPVQLSRAEKAARLQAYQSLTPEQRSFLDRASEAVADKEEKRARNVAYRLLQSAKAEIGEQKRSTTAAGISSARTTAARDSLSTGRSSLQLPQTYHFSLGTHRLDHAY